MNYTVNMITILSKPISWNYDILYLQNKILISKGTQNNLPESEGPGIDFRLWSITLLLAIFLTTFPLITFYLETTGRPAEPNLKKGTLLGKYSEYCKYGLTLLTKYKDFRTF